MVCLSHFIGCSFFQLRGGHIVDGINDVIAVGGIAVQRAQAAVGDLTGQTHGAHSGGSGLQRLVGVGGDEGCRQGRELAAGAGDAAHHGVAVADAVSLVGVGHDVNGTGDGHHSTGAGRKGLGKSHGAVQIFLGDLVGHIGIHALGGTGTGGQGLDLGDVAPDDREFHLPQQAVGGVGAQLGSTGAHGVQHHGVSQQVGLFPGQQHAGDGAAVQGVWFEEDYVRDYPLKTLASNVIGVGSNSGGASGLESYYTDVLSGTDGREFGYLDENSDLQRTIVEPTNGNTIVSTLDINIQQVVEKYIAEFDAEYGKDAEDGKGAKNIGVIVGNPQNGEIYAMASNHGFDLTDPDDLSDKYTDAELKSMTEEEKSDALNEKWYNYCVSESFEPGSTFKPIVVASALEMGAITTDATYVCDGGEFVTDTEIKCDNIYGHGDETLSDVIKNSCNDAMMQIGMKMQITPFLKYQRLFNFGSRTGIDLPNESTGVLYDRDSMHEVELATNTFGQTFTSTMIQEYAAFNAVVNGGYYYEPHMVKQILDDNSGVVKNINPVLLRQPVSTKNADFVLSAMEQTVLDGTGKKARVPGYRVAGKTGTAEKINPETGTRWEGKYLVSFIGCAPVDDPQLTVYVVVDEPNVENQETGGYSMIISRKIMMEVLPYLNIPQTEEITDELLQELELTREDVENGRNAALIKEKSETTETDEYGNVISSGTTAETDEYGNVISSGTTAETDEYGNVISSGTTSGSTSSATGTTDAQTSQTDAYGNVISGSDSTTQGTTDDEGSAFHSNIPAPLQSQDSGDGVSTQDWITNEKLGIDENNNSY